jgi:carnitine O-palmitoyltransferase 1, liver isoform
MRYTLRLLLTYKGFLFESRGKSVSMKTKIWAILVKIFVKWNSPKIYSFQGSLPRLPLPALNDTMSKYLRSVRPLLDDKSYKEVVKQTEEFENGIGKKLQRYLVLKSWWSTNYVSDWWEEYVYLRGRSPLMVNSNYYGTDYFGSPNVSQTARAASYIHWFCQFRRKLDREEIPPIMVQGFVPLCSAQYERAFNTTRIPGVETDKIIHYKDSHHVAVLHKGSFYKVLIYHKGRLLNALEIQYQLDKIVKSNETASHGEKHLGALTAWNRTKWAQARDKYFSKGINKSSLQVIESAVFFVHLSDEESHFAIDKDEKKWNEYVKDCLHGKVCDRWFDKSISLSFGTNGKV